jgi:hypothetical protein
LHTWAWDGSVLVTGLDGTLTGVVRQEDLAHGTPATVAWSQGSRVVLYAFRARRVVIWTHPPIVRAIGHASA